MLRRSRFTLIALAVAALAVASATPAVASATGAATEAAAAKAKSGKKGSRNRLGGKVRRAWPAPGAKGRSKTPLTRWLARQVGPQKVVPCKQRPPRARRRCARDAGASTAGGAATVATAAANRPTEQVAVGKATGERRLSLIRSFDIPVDDPSYPRLLNWSWTYDSALAATAFSSVGLGAQSPSTRPARRAPTRERSDRVRVRRPDA